MPQFSESTVSSGAAITSTKINAVINAIGTAFNTLDSTNFSSSTAVPNNALAAGKSYFTLRMCTPPSATQTGAKSDENYGMVIVPVAATLVSCKFVCEATTISAGPVTLDVKEDGTTSVLSSAVSVTASDDMTVKNGTVSTSSFSADDILAFIINMGASDTVINATCILTFKVAHTS